ncbi:UNVERIFIED_CONTAM: hypothetical protein Sindi_2488000, partial [Sesamum indicum]
DHKTEDVVAVACLIGKLYILKKHSFDKDHIEAVISSSSECRLNPPYISKETWHRRLRHSSYN